MTHVPASSHTVFNGGMIADGLNIAPNTDETALFASVPNGAFSRVVEFDCAPNKPGYMFYDADGTLYVRLPNAVPALIVSGDSGATQDIAVFQANNGSHPVSFPATGGIKASPITSGSLPTVAPVSGTAFQCSTTRDVSLLVPVTYNPGVATTATCKVELSPDNVTFSTLITITQPVGTVFDGSIEPVQFAVPAAWYVKLTVTNATLGTGTYY